MKRIVLGLLLVMFAVSAQAREITPGTVKLSGATNASFFNSTIDVNGNEISDTDTFLLETDAVYFLTKNIAVGGTVSIENSDTDFAGGAKDETTTLIIGPTVAVDVPLSEAINFIADATIGYFQMDGEDEVGEYLDADGFA